MSIRNYLKNILVSRETETIVDKIPKPVGSFGYDPWGYNTDAVKIALSVMRPVFEDYFRVEAYGLENIPANGRLLLIANHGGQLPIDGSLVAYALATNQHAPRAVRVMVERWLPTLPFVGNIFNEMGAVIGDPDNCARMLRREEAIIVFPEGVRGSGKPWSKRYKLQRFGLGFMHLAITENTPIVPVGVVGCEETMPTPFHFKRLAKIFGMPYLPLTTPLPLPTKVRLYFGEPMHFEGPISNEDEVAIKVERVKEEINKLIEKGLQARKGWFE
ncbi:acyltransferase family protein [Ketobacter sp. MCCC 1A13808]|uniref:lysophospholipid acyltransferase family protein n=1 Tax=Ketobacter sp. MCCC 1A13808 TaxID=2602738 RepID=UPI000F1CF81F|nr:lysophospholipid acyltransferase family protein [Ketobacter sp. MCCC 1A13808]MVF11306.1 acyltransferase family protein [Ketobacter sp. MCCC 1A13808]RLP52553.1 MAG: acyltransferase family protein [Ketobacter sp.]